VGADCPQGVRKRHKSGVDKTLQPGGARADKPRHSYKVTREMSDLAIVSFGLLAYLSVGPLVAKGVIREVKNRGVCWQGLIILGIVYVMVVTAFIYRIWTDTGVL
jgi:hypothetical protein